MSKAALYAGLGRGLMALGQGVGNAITQEALERMRQQSLNQRWAMQQAERKEDRDFQARQLDKRLDAQNDARVDDQNFKRDLATQELQGRKDLENLRHENNLKELAAKPLNNVNTPAKVAEVKHMAKAMNISEGEAWNRTLQAKTDPEFKQKMRFDYINSQMEGFISEDPKAREKHQELLGQEFERLFNGETPSANDTETKGAEGNAPQAALDALEKDPSRMPEFEAKYGYRPW